MAIGSLLTSAGGAITLIGIQLTYGAETANVFGIALSTFAVTALLCAGLGISTIASLKNAPPGTSEFAHQVVSVFQPAVTATTLLMIGAPLFGLASAVGLGLPGPLFWSAFGPMVLAICVLPVNQVLGALQQLAGGEVHNLRNSLENLALRVAVLLLVIGLVSSSVIAFLLLGLLDLLIDLWTVRRRLRSLPYLHDSMRRTVRNAAKRVFDAPGTALRMVGLVTASNADGLLLVVTFLIVNQSALGFTGADAGWTAVGIAIMRSSVLPLKSIGLVGGRLIAAPTIGASDRLERVRTAISESTRMVIPFAAVGLIAAWIISADGDQPGLSIMVLCMAGQVLIEPISSVLFTILKIQISPRILIGKLIVVLWGALIPAIFVLLSMDALNLTRLWPLLLGARIVFALVVLTRYRRWSRASSGASER
ncbi:hypothetical protein M2390_003055 [Mycetocola sp. BIGb0189]|uniref:hypothetical protein n=1 Tax=Mycetocola sp. BIGb0189 TaxID=2940604 RepID=UPI002168BE4E|nr:hypothetical protein [Mycetocola sp. BIGb0189]MCS4277840.1 hypothetical protein [Mycetocola sp. BIGb0189]